MCVPLRRALHSSDRRASGIARDGAGKLGYQKSQEKHEKEKRARRGRQLVTQFGDLER